MHNHLPNPSLSWAKTRCPLVVNTGRLDIEGLDIGRGGGGWEAETRQEAGGGGAERRGKQKGTRRPQAMHEGEGRQKNANTMQTKCKKIAKKNAKKWKESAKKMQKT